MPLSVTHWTHIGVTDLHRFKRLQDHPMRQRLSQPTKSRLMRAVSPTRADTCWTTTGGHRWSWPLRFPHVLPSLPGVRELPPPFGVPSLVLVWKTPKAALRESPSLRNTFKAITQESPGLLCTSTALLRMQFGMEGQKFTSNTQEAEKTKLASLLAYNPQTKKLKQKPWR